MTAVQEQQIGIVPALAPGCGLTVLRAVKDFRATKKWKYSTQTGLWGKISYEAGKWFRAAEHPVRDLAELADLLECLRRDPTAFVVRGELVPWARTQIAEQPESLITRRKLKKNDIEPPLAEVARRWVMVDIDNWPLPAWGDLVDDPGAVIEAAIFEILPEPFHNAECWWQLSASAGFVPGFLKGHLFFWLSGPATNQHIKAVLKQHADSDARRPRIPI